MKYLMLNRFERKTLLRRLEAMPAFLEETFSPLSAGEHVAAGPDGSFSPVEHSWHLADLEREGFGARIRRLLGENDPVLPDFDGGRIAEEREYRSRTLAEGIAAFQRARQENLDLLRTMNKAQWSRSGTQEGVGPVMLCDLPHMMTEHDDAHRGEIGSWVAGRRDSALGH